MRPDARSVSAALMQGHADAADQAADILAPGQEGF